MTRSDTATRPHGHQRGRQWLLAPFEPARAAAELGALMLAAPALIGAHTADEHPVLVIPGLSGGKGWSTVMRTYLGLIGHSVHSPRFATTKAPAGRVVRRLIERVDELAEKHGTSVSLVGWSVGGCLARQVAAARPGGVRQLVTLGAPLDGRAWYAPGHEQARGRLPVPVTAIVSRTDGIFDWRRCLQPPGPLAENVEIPSSHLGMASHPMTLHVVADRLSQLPGQWRPFRPFT